MSYLRPSSEIDLVRPVIACFVDVYAIVLGRGACAEIEPLLTMRPPRGDCDFIARYAACAHRNAPVRLMSTACRHCASVRSSIGAPTDTPALLNRKSIRPKVSAARLKSVATDSASATSVGTASAAADEALASRIADRKSTRLNSSHGYISYAV